MNKKVITDIDQKTGVTPEQLLEQCEYLYQTFNLTYNISKEEKWDIISNTVVSTYNKMKQGYLSSTNYEEFKNYLFMTMKNNIRLCFNNKKQYNRRWLDYIEIDDDIAQSNYNIEKSYENKDLNNHIMKVVQKVLKTFNERDKKVLIDYINGIPQTEIANKIGVTRSIISSIRKKLVDKVQLIIYKKTISSYKKRK